MGNSYQPHADVRHWPGRQTAERKVAKVAKFPRITFGNLAKKLGNLASAPAILTECARSCRD